MDKNNKGYAFYVPQGGFAVFKISKSKKEEGEGQKSEEIRVPKIDEVFTDGLSPCSYVIIIIETPTANYCIFAHMDASTNIIDPDNGLFAILEKKQQQYGLLNEDIKIYFEHGVNNPNPNPFGNDYLVSFDYKNYVESYLKWKKKAV